jgi:hypothetical protein
MAAITAATALEPVSETLTKVRRYKAAATTITAGEAVYISANDTVAIADKDTLANSQAIGVAMQTATKVGNYIDVCVEGPVTGYSGLTAGKILWVMDDGGLTETFNGGAAANGDLLAADFATQIGYVENATTIYVRPKWNGVVLT